MNNTLLTGVIHCRVKIETFVEISFCSIKKSLIQYIPALLFNNNFNFLKIFFSEFKIKY